MVCLKVGTVRHDHSVRALDSNDFFFSICAETLLNLIRAINARGVYKYVFVLAYWTYRHRFLAIQLNQPDTVTHIIKTIHIQYYLCTALTYNEKRKRNKIS